MENVKNFMLIDVKDGTNFHIHVMDANIANTVPILKDTTIVLKLKRLQKETELNQESFQKYQI